jgi:benzoyl-CoA reductase/2-hydroxyglutaryl-CoA dehydratase subunit BcrC/BadD/HgdB
MSQEQIDFHISKMTGKFLHNHKDLESQFIQAVCSCPTQMLKLGTRIYDNNKVFSLEPTETKCYTIAKDTLFTLYSQDDNYVPFKRLVYNYFKKYNYGCNRDEIIDIVNFMIAKCHLNGIIYNDAVYCNPKLVELKELQISPIHA